MAVYVISYDLSNSTGTEYSELDAFIKQNIDTSALKPTESTYFVYSSMTVEELRNVLLPYFKSAGDKLVIAEVGKFSACGGSGLSKETTSSLSVKLMAQARIL